MFNAIIDEHDTLIDYYTAIKNTYNFKNKNMQNKRNPVNVSYAVSQPVNIKDDDDYE